jgi:hypothetical protein
MAARRAAKARTKSGYKIIHRRAARQCHNLLQDGRKCLDAVAQPINTQRKER